MKLTFVDATNNPQLFDWVRMRNEIANCPVFNFYSLYMYGVQLDGLVPDNNTMKYFVNYYGTEDGNSYYFDQAYANQLLLNPRSWVDLMQIMGAIQFYPEVIILTDYTSDQSIPVVDSLIKFIQQRYELNCFIVKDLIDINQFEKSDFETQAGYNNFMQDWSRFKAAYYTEKQILSEVVDVE